MNTQYYPVERTTDAVRHRLTVTNIDVFAFFFSILSILKSWLYIRQSGTDIGKMEAEIVIAICTVIVFLMAFHKNLIQLKNLKWCVFPLAFSFFRMVYRYDRKISISDSGITVILLVCFYILMEDRYKKRVYEILRLLFIIISIIGIIIFISYTLSLPLPHTMVKYYALGMQPKARYADYGGMVLFVSRTGTVRLCGPFNEPGLFGTYVGLLLISDNMNFRKPGNIILFIAGVMSFSLAFVYVVFGWVVYKNCRDWRVIVFALLAIVFVLAIPYIRFDNEVVQAFYERAIRFVDNRTTRSFNEYFRHFIKSSRVWTGVGGGYDVVGISSIKRFIVEYGLIGTALYILYVFNLGRNYANRNIASYVFIFLFVLSMYQRPEVLGPVYIVILIGGVKHLNTLFDKGNADENYSC